MTKGLSLARMFYLAGHDVIGADFESYHIPVSGRFSKSLKRFYSLPYPGKAENILGRDRYRAKMLRIIRKENVKLWVSCSGVATAVDDAGMMEVLHTETDCRSIQFSEEVTSILDDKGRFNQYLEKLRLPAPEAHVVSSRNEVHKILASRVASTKKSYILKSIAMNDAVRGDLTKLPKRTVSDTYNHLASLSIQPNRPHLLQEFVSGTEYCTHSLVIDNQIESFVACPSSDLLMHYQALNPGTPLHDAMLKFTQEFASRVKRNLTGHLSFDFVVVDSSSESGVSSQLYPIECNPRAHTAVALFDGTERTMARRYLQATVQSKMVNGVLGLEHEPTFPQNPKPVYWIGHDLVTLVIRPLLLFSIFKMSPRELAEHLHAFITHILLWKDGTFEVWDPLPFFWLYHIYWPAHFAVSIVVGSWWSRINVSTMKKFAVD